MADKVGGPIVKPLLGKTVVPDDSPFTTGGIGLLGTAPSQDAMEECDTLLIAASSFPYLEFYSKLGQAKTIQIEIDATAPRGRRRARRRLPRRAARVAAAGRAKIRPLIPGAGTDADEEMEYVDGAAGHADRSAAQAAGRRPSLERAPAGRCDRVGRQRDHCHVGRSPHSDARHHAVLASGTLATMGNALPYGIGAAVAYPGRQVISIVGDGGFTMLMGEVATLVKYQLPVKVIIFKNDVLG